MVYPFMGEGSAIANGFVGDNARSQRCLPWPAVCDEWSATAHRVEDAAGRQGHAPG
jgi:hypothetical protein